MRQSWFNLIQRETGADRQILCASIEHQIVTSIGEHQSYGRCSQTRATFAATRDMQADAIFICILTGQARKLFEMDRRRYCDANRQTQQSVLTQQPAQ